MAGAFEYVRIKDATGVEFYQRVWNETAASATGPKQPVTILAKSDGTVVDAATSIKQPALGTAGVASADVITVQGIASGTAQPISAASLPLPTGAPTAADLGAKADAAATTDTGTFSIIAFIKRGLQNWTNLLAKIPALGQATMTASTPVVLASNQSTINVSTVPVAASIAVGQVSVAVTATLIVAARAARRGVTVMNEGATDVRIGDSGVTTATGLLLFGQKGSGVIIDGGAAIYGIVASGTQSVSYLEAY